MRDEVFVRVAVVGCGQRFTSAIGPVLRSLGAQAVVIADPDRNARERAAENIGDSAVIATDTLTAAAISATSPEAVIIASPSGLHFEHAAIALGCGLPTFVEKPPARTATELRMLGNLAGDALKIGEHRRYRADMRLARSLIERGLIGDLRALRYVDSVTPATAFQSSWRNDPALAGGGALMDLGYHAVRAIQWLTGVTTDNFVITDAQLCTANLRVESRAQAEAHWEDVKLSLDIRCDGTRPGEELTITGTRGQLSVQRSRAAAAVSVVTFTDVSGRMKSAQITLDGEHDNKSLRDFLCGAPRDVSVSDHAHTLAFIEKVYQCAIKTSGIAMTWKY